MAGHFEHERQRLLSLVDNFIDHIESSYDEEDAPRIDIASICAIIEWTDSDGETYGVPAWYSESQRPHIQMGVFDSCSLRLKGKLMSMDSTTTEDD